MFILLLIFSRSALLEQMPLMEVNRTKDALDGDESGNSLLDTSPSVERNNIENVKPPATTQTEVRDYRRGGWGCCIVD